jgi:hypothetical protein
LEVGEGVKRERKGMRSKSEERQKADLEGHHMHTLELKISWVSNVKLGRVLGKKETC